MFSIYTLNLTTKYVPSKKCKYLLTMSHIMTVSSSFSSQSTAGEELLRGRHWERLWESECWVLCCCVCSTCSERLCCRCLFMVNSTLSFFLRETVNCRTETVTADTPRCPRRRRTWLFSGGEGLFSRHSFACYQITQQMDCVDTRLIIHRAPRPPTASCDPSFCPSHALSSFCLQARYERAAGNWESLRGGAALCVAG